MSLRIVNEVRGVNRVRYGVTLKPHATVEYKYMRKMKQAVGEDGSIFAAKSATALTTPDTHCREYRDEDRWHLMTQNKSFG